MHEITHAVRYCSPTKKETPQLPFFRTYADPDKYDAGNALEHELFGKKGFERMVKKVEDIEKELDIYNLDKFTPH